MEVGIEEDQMLGFKYNWQDCVLMFYISELISVYKNIIQFIERGI